MPRGNRDHHDGERNRPVRPQPVAERDDPGAGQHQQRSNRGHQEAQPGVTIEARIEEIAPKDPIRIRAPPRPRSGPAERRRLAETSTRRRSGRYQPQPDQRSVHLGREHGVAREVRQRVVEREEFLDVVARLERRSVEIPTSTAATARKTGFFDPEDWFIGVVETRVSAPTTLPLWRARIGESATPRWPPTTDKRRGRSRAAPGRDASGWRCRQRRRSPAQRRSCQNSSASARVHQAAAAKSLIGAQVSWNRNAGLDASSTAARAPHHGPATLRPSGSAAQTATPPSGGTTQNTARRPPSRSNKAIVIGRPGG